MLSGRMGHAAIHPTYTVGRARFTSGSTAVVGSAAGNAYGYEDTAWQTSGAVRAGDLIIGENQYVPYVVQAVVDDNHLTLSAAYTGTTTGNLLTARTLPGEGFEYYMILSQDSVIAGGEVAHEPTEVFRFSPTGTWPGGVPADYAFVAGQPLTALQGRYGHDLVSLGDMRLLAVGGRNRTYGEYTVDPGNSWDFTNDTWSTANLDSEIWDFPRAFRVPNNMIIVISQHSAQAFLHE